MLDIPLENDGILDTLSSGLPSWQEDDLRLQEDDLRLLRHSGGAPSWLNCCSQLCHTLRSWRGLRASDLDALQRRQKGQCPCHTARVASGSPSDFRPLASRPPAAAEWSNAFSDGDWGSSTGPGSQTSDAIAALDVEMDDFSMEAHPHMDDYLHQPRMGALPGLKAAPAPPALSPHSSMPQQEPSEFAERRA